MSHPRPPSRAVRWSILVLLLAIGVGALLAKYFANAALKVPPVGYVVALEDDTRVRLRWKTRLLSTSYTLSRNASVSVPAGKKVLLVRANGRQETVTGPSRIQLSTSDADALDFLTAPLGDLLSNAPAAIENQDSLGPIRVTSPVGVTRYRNPIITWTAQQGVTYDVAVIDPADDAAPPRLRRGVLPPVPLATLETTQAPELPTDRIFAVIVRKAGDMNVLATARFLTAADASTAPLPASPPELLTEAIAALAQKPARTGDAWLALSRLPETWKESELAIRLRLKAATDLGLTDEITVLKAALRKL